MVLLTLDLSTKSTGYALFVDGKLSETGTITPGKIKGISKMVYPESAYERNIRVAEQVTELYLKHEPDVVYIEEINRGINRIAQKSLDGLHFLVLDRLKSAKEDILTKIHFIDSNGASGWRGVLDISTKPYKGIKKSRSEKWKKAAEEYVNEALGTDYDVWEHPEQADECDAVAIGLAVLKKGLT